MSRIGNDLLPNIYVSEIEVHDNHFISKVYVVDDLESPTWSRTNLYKEQYKIMIVYSKSQSLVRALNSGTIRMDPKELYKTDPSVVIEKIPISQTTEMVKDDKKYFCFTFKNKIEILKSPLQEDLFLFCSVVIDPMPIVGPSYHYKGFIQGPISSEQIILKSEINKKTFIFLDDRESQWIGPVHFHEETGWMGGSKHTNRPHPSLRQITIDNTKIKDLREEGFSLDKKHIMDSSFLFSELFSSFDRDGKYNFLFFINLKELVINKTKYGAILAGTSENLLDLVLNNLKFSLLAFNRHRIKTYNQTTSAGTKKKSTERVIRSKRVFSSFQDGTSYRKTFGDGFLRNNNFLSDKNIKSFEFVDNEMKKGLAGEYKYSLILHFTDPTIKLVETMHNELQTSLETLQSFTNRVNRFFKKNKTMLTLTNSFIESEDVRSNYNQELHPWIMCSETYVKYSSLLFSLDSDQVEDLKKTSLNFLNPKTLSINSLKTFESKFRDLMNLFTKKLELNISKIKNFSLRSYPKNNATINLVSITKDYDEVVKPTKSKKFYNFLQPKLSPGVKILKPSDFKTRVNLETKKFFVKKPKFKNLTILNNLNSSMSSFFSPFSLSDNRKEINVTNLSEINKNEFNSFFKDRIRAPRNFTIAINKSLIDKTKDDSHILSSEYLGKQTNFTSSAEEVFCSFNVDDSPTSETLKRNIILKPKRKLLFKFSQDNHVSVFKNKFKPRLGAEKENPIIPNQLRAIAAGDSEFTVEEMNTTNLISPENDLIVSTNNLNLMQVEVLDGFKKTKNGNLNLKNPIWKMVTSFEQEAPADNSLYRMVPSKSKTTNFDIDSDLQLEYSDKFFSISNLNLSIKELREMNVKRPAETKEVGSIEIFNNYSGYNLDAANSNIVFMQRATSEEEIIPSTTLSSDVQPATTPVQSSVAPTVSYTGGMSGGGSGGMSGGGSGGMSGGGY